MTNLYRPKTRAFTLSHGRWPTNQNAHCRGGCPVSRGLEMEAQTYLAGTFKLSHGTRPASTSWTATQRPQGLMGSVASLYTPALVGLSRLNLRPASCRP